MKGKHKGDFFSKLPAREDKDFKKHFNRELGFYAFRKGIEVGKDRTLDLATFLLTEAKEAFAYSRDTRRY